MQPIIGITTNQDKNLGGQTIVTLSRIYAEAVLQTGGIPVLLPSLVANEGWGALYSRLDGILFSGGGDVSLEFFKGEPHPSIEEVDLERDTVELDFLQAAVDDGKPFLGICRGCQLVNVGLGGTLYTHLPDQLPGALDHSRPGSEREALVHEVRIEEGTKLAEVLGEPIIKVNSHHHQGLKDLGTGLRAAGYAPDGLVEAIELPDHPFGLAVQWHPEWLMDQPPTQKLFKAFVEASTKTSSK
jgi:putative glutamine amidotransferase